MKHFLIKYKKLGEILETRARAHEKKYFVFIFFPTI